jgi:hypothetical protein
MRTNQLFIIYDFALNICFAWILLVLNAVAHLQMISSLKNAALFFAFCLPFVKLILQFQNHNCTTSKYIV